MSNDLSILLVEDSSSERKYIKQVVHSLGHRISVCSNGEEAWELIQKNNYNLVLLDWVLPGMDGLELCRRLRTTPSGERVSIVVITVRSRPQDLEKVLEAGADDYISKMAGPDLFRVRLRIALQQANVRLQRLKAENQVLQKTGELGERVKELNCLYGLANILDQQDVAVEEKLGNVCRFITQAWQHPEIACSRLIFQGKEYQTDNYQDTTWKLSAVLIINRSEQGLVEIDYLENKSGKDPFTKEERRLFKAVAEQIARSLERINREKALEALNARLLKDQRSAAQTQQTLLPRNLPKTENLTFHYLFSPYEEVGGDMLNVFWLDDTTIGLYLLDVAGHGVAAALFAVTINSILQPRTNHSSLARLYLENKESYRVVPPAAVVEKLNSQFLLGSDNELLFTLVYGLVNTKTLQFDFVAAGHQGIVHQPHKQSPILMEMKTFPVGATKNPEYETQSMQLHPGDRFYLFSDGITEASNAKQEQYGNKRLMQVFDRSANIPFDESAAKILADVAVFRGPMSQDDDMAILCLEVAIKK